MLRAMGEGGDTGMSETVFSIMEQAPILPPEAPGETAYEVFSADPDLLVCAVVQDGRPAGLLTRDRFFLRMADRYGRALYSRRPVTFVMQTDPLLVSEDTPIEQLSAHILSARPGALMDGFVVTRDDRYLGVVSTLGLFSATVKAVADRSARLERLAADLSEAERQARESARAKSEFLATMSHEIRTPLNGVLGLSALLTRSNLAPDHARLARTIHESGSMLLSLLNNILDMSKMEAGGLALRPEAFALDTLAAEMRDLWSARARESGVAWRVDATPPGAEIEADLSRIRQVLMNLIGNALKFTPAGEVTVTLSLEPCSLPGRGRLRAEVRDTGVGIPARALESIFQPFQQADSTFVRKFDGAGLGLAICQRLVSLMEGEIGVDSREGAGSLFWVEIPVIRRAAEARDSAAA